MLTHIPPHRVASLRSNGGRYYLNQDGSVEFSAAELPRLDYNLLMFEHGWRWSMVGQVFGLGGRE